MQRLGWDPRNHANSVPKSYMIYVSTCVKLFKGEKPTVTHERLLGRGRRRRWEVEAATPGPGDKMTSDKF